jgi:hypothetical protein
MTAPTARLRALVYRRDGHCVACGVLDGWTFQHRQASGMGGRGKRAPQLSAADGLTACGICNMRFESDMHDLALTCGWKVRRNCRVPLSEVPYRDAMSGLWWLPDADGHRLQVNALEALERLTAAGNMTRKGVA